MASYGLGKTATLTMRVRLEQLLCALEAAREAVGAHLAEAAVRGGRRLGVLEHFERVVDHVGLCGQTVGIR